MNAGSTFAEPRVVGLEDCLFYRVMEIPGVGVTRGRKTPGASPGHCYDSYEHRSTPIVP